MKDFRWPEYIKRPLPWEKADLPNPPAARHGNNGDTDLSKRISAYIAAVPGAVSGQGGHGQTFKAACYLVNGWGLSAAEALPYLQTYNQRCEPPWTDKELAHKLSDAEKAQHAEPRGHLLGSQGHSAKEQPLVQPRKLPQIVLPKLNRQESRFAADVGRALGPLDVLFRYQDGIVEIRNEPFTGEFDKSKLAIGGLKFSALSPTRARTWIEDYVVTGINVSPPKNENGDSSGESKFVPQTMKQAVAGGLMVSPQFASGLPVIYRIIDVAIPIKKQDGSVITPKRGFNRKLGIYCNPQSPQISEISLKRAKEVLDETLEGFAWKNDQSKVHAIARILTPYARGIMGFHARPPLWYFNGNRPRAGKDYLAGVAQIVYLGHAFEDASLGEDSEETRKRITAAIVSGRRMMHFANCQGFIESAPFIQAITAQVWRTRALGSTSAESDLELPNEIEYSISANVGLSYREDLEPRLRKIELAFYDEHENSRLFPKAFLHDWVAENRPLILSAVACFFEYWIENDMPAGLTPFNSFPEWAAVIGGVMHTCELGNPCLPHEDKDIIGGDRRTTAMRALYELIFALRPNLWTPKQDIFELIEANQHLDDRLEWFGDFTGNQKKKAVTRTGMAISTFQNRILGGITLQIDSSESNSRRHQILFSKL